MNDPSFCSLRTLFICYSHVPGAEIAPDETQCGGRETRAIARIKIESVHCVIEPIK